MSEPFDLRALHPVDFDPRGLVACLRESLDDFDDDVVRHAKTQHRNLDPVATVELSEDGFTAQVEYADEDDLEASWKFAFVDQEVFDADPNCTCEDGGACEHAYLAALKFLQLHKQGYFDRERRVLRGPATAAGNERAPENASRAIPEAESPLVRAVRDCEETLTRKLSKGEEIFLRLLAKLHSLSPATGGVSSWHFRDLGLPIAGTELTDKLWASPMIMRGWWETKPSDLLEFAAFVEHFSESAGVHLPEWLRVLLPLERNRRLVDEARQRMEEKRWLDNLEQMARASPVRAGAIVPQFPARFRLVLESAAQARWEYRETEGSPWTVAKATQFKEWSNTCGESEAAAMPAARALRDFKERGSARFHRAMIAPPRLESSRFPLEQPLQRDFLLDAVADEHVRPMVCTAAGEALQDGGEMHWHLAPDPARPGWVRAELRHADGSPLGEAAIIQHDPPRAIDGSRIVRLPPALERGAALSWKPVSFPGQTLHRETAVNALHAIGSVIESALLPPHEFVSLKPRFDLQTSNQQEGGSRLRLAVSAVDAAGQTAGQWVDGRWEIKLERSASDGVMRIADSSALAPVGKLVRDLRLKQDDAARLSRPMTMDCAAEVSTWVERARAGGAEVRSSADLAGLFREAPALKLRVQARPASAPNELGGKIDWFDVQIEWQLEDVTLSPEEIALLLKANGRPVNLPGRGWQKLRVEARAEDEARLRSLGIDPATLLSGGRKETLRLHALQIAAEKDLAELISARQQAVLRRRVAELRAEPGPDLPPGLTAEMRPYQVDGFRFLAFLSRNGLGGVLADDMGLGKTVQALAWLLWLRDRRLAAGGSRPFRALVVCPKSVLHNWEREAGRFAPGLRTEVYRADRDLKSENQPALLAVNYAQLRGQAEDFTAVEWDAVILDEAQAIKNPSSQTAQTARELRATHRLALTGTPIENRLLDLWSILAFSQPGLLGTRASFHRLYGESAEARSRLSRRVRPFLLRRSKAQVAADLPARIEEDLACDLEPEQRMLYEAELKRARGQLLKVETDRQLDDIRFTILQSLLRLRQICCDPRLVGGEGESAKFDALFDTIEPLLEEGHKVLVFSQFVRMLEYLRTALEQRGHRHWWLTGDTEDRAGAVDAFQSSAEPGVFLLSLKAGGTGLNLTAASYVVLFDPWWNPAVEAQAIDRTHRIGQTNQVIAYRLLARNTVEEKIRLLQRSKAMLAGSVVQEEGDVGRVMDLASLRFVLD